ncbi:uncharacterized protein N7482_002053 [Penicillium canariense]|uniref:Uncharacterized protein n=1 Tax=Penicillium canariense TaxID=189055 RepID=A0A9W9IIA7_9EURO|nr:uncharacterized protein N7482_002053 [Penicillium canariense]KAJ5176176.1 hypothetical protein N7482_002053 [Penicillium canariense]
MTAPISVSGGWWTFTNYAPLTTTFTPAPSCTASDRFRIGYINHGYPYLEYAVQCTKDVDYTDCVPSATTTATSWPTPPGHHGWAGIGGYYSPGLYCPSGWETMGVAARDASSSLTSSGILSTTPAPSTTSSDPMAYYYATATWDDPATILKGVLEPEQTMAVCCPSSFTADPYGGCYSVATDFKPTVGCEAYRGYNYEFGDTTVAYSYHGITSTRVMEVPTITVYKSSTITHTFNRFEIASDRYSAISYVPMITLLHHQSDVASASLASASASAAAAAASANATASAAATSNAAVRLGGRSGYDGVGAVVGVAVAAMALGAAIVLQ